MDRSIIKRLSIVAVAACGIVGYSHLSAETRVGDIILGLGLLGSLPADIPGYIERFLLSFLLLGAVPAGALLLTGSRLREAGLRFPVAQFSALSLAGLLVAGVVIGFVGSRFAPLSSFYPYAASLPVLVARHGWWVFLAHAAGYVVLFYLPWEFLFRGILILPLVDGTDIGVSRPTSAAVAIACLQAIASSLLHFGHPFSESLLAVPFGVFLGWMVLRSGSVLPGLLIHAASGVSLDFFVVLSRIPGSGSAG